MLEYTKFQLEIFKKQHIPQYLGYVFESFDPQSSKQSGWGIAKQQFTQSTQKLANLFIQSSEHINQLKGTSIPFNTFIRIDGKMAVACFSCELHRFMAFYKEGKIASKIYSYFPATTLIENQQHSSVITVRHAVNKDFFRKGLYSFHSIQRSKLMMKKGYKYELGVIINPIVLEYYRKRGAQITLIKVEANNAAKEAHLFKIPYQNILRNSVQ